MRTEKSAQPIPKREAANPRFAQLWVNNKNSRCKKSKTDVDKPHHPIPKNKTTDSMQAKLWVDNRKSK